MKNRKEKIRPFLAGFMIMCLFAGGCAGEEETYFSRADALTELETESETVFEKSNENENSDKKVFVNGTEGSSEETVNVREDDLPETIQVFVCGAVSSPGVYPLPSDSRVVAAIEAAGGMTDEASVDVLNQAAPLSDGEKVYVPREGEEINDINNINNIGSFSVSENGSAAAMEADDGKININTADQKALMTLPGIGESKASAIIAYREQHGAFSAISDIKNITGIKDGVFNKIQDYIKV